MKIRTGFVSNSSSSSFMLVAKKDEFNEILKTMHGYIQFMTRRGSVHKFENDEMIVFIGEDSTEEPPYELESGNYFGEILGNDQKVVGILKSDENIYDTLSNWIEWPAYKGQCLWFVSEEMKKCGKPVIYKSESS